MFTNASEGERGGEGEREAEADADADADAKAKAKADANANAKADADADGMPLVAERSGELVEVDETDVVVPAALEEPGLRGLGSGRFWRWLESLHPAVEPWRRRARVDEARFAWGPVGTWRQAVG